jgi:hypothetical protein
MPVLVVDIGEVRDRSARQDVIYYMPETERLREDLYTFGEQGEWHQQRGVPKRSPHHQSLEEVAEHCWPLCEEKEIIVLPAIDRDLSEPAVKGNAWNMNCARESHMAEEFMSVYSHIDVYMDTDDMRHGCKQYVSG